MAHAPARRRANPAGLIYGVLAIETIIAAETSQRQTFPKLIAASAIAMAMYWLASAYSHHWGSRLRQSAGWTVKEFTTSLMEEATILVGAALPTIVLLSAWVAGATVETGVTAVLWVGCLEVGLLEIATGIRRRLGLRDLAVQSLIGIALGLGILVVRLLLH